MSYKGKRERALIRYIRRQPTFTKKGPGRRPAHKAFIEMFGTNFRAAGIALGRMEREKVVHLRPGG